MQMHGVGVPRQFNALLRSVGNLNQNSPYLTTVITAMGHDVGQHLFTRHIPVVPIGEREGYRFGQHGRRDRPYIVEVPVIRSREASAQFRERWGVGCIVRREVMTFTNEMRREDPVHYQTMIHEPGSKMKFRRMMLGAQSIHCVQSKGHRRAATLGSNASMVSSARLCDLPSLLANQFGSTTSRWAVFALALVVSLAGFCLRWLTFVIVGWALA